MGVIIVMLAIAFLAIKYFSPALTALLYDHSRFDILNILSRNSGELPLSAYLGDTVDITWGPLQQIFSGLAFVLFVFSFIPRANTFRFGLAVLGYLLLTKWEVLFFPLYGDAIGGPFAEAFWLAHNNFNYAELLRQPGYAEGGPRVYVFSAYPGFLALTLKIFPGRSFLVFNHLLTFIMGAVIAAKTRAILRRIVPLDTATLAALALSFFALFQSQIEAVNMEIPCTLFITLCLHALTRRRMHRAAVYALLAMLAKGTGITAIAAYMITAFYLFFLRRESRFRPAPVFWSLALAGAALARVYSKFLFKDQHVLVGMIKPLAGLPSLEYIYITKPFLAALTVILLFRFLRPRLNRWREDLKKLTGFPVFVVTAFAVSWFAFFLNFSVVNPRYQITVYPALIIMITISVCIILPRLWQRNLAMLVLIVIALWGSYGLFSARTRGNDHVQLERSLEYRNDLKMNRMLAQRLEKEYSGQTIVAPFTIAQQLGIPRLGYVREDLDVKIYGFKNTYADNISNFPGQHRLNWDRTLYVGLYDANLDLGFPYPIAKSDRILETIRYGGRRAEIFRGGEAIQKVWLIIKMMNK